MLALALLSPGVAVGGDSTLERLTPRNPYPRAADGRPLVPDYWLERLRYVSTSLAAEALAELGYCCQFMGGFHNTAPGKTLIGRAFTARFLPSRPDVEGIIEADAKAKGLDAHPTKRVIDMLSPGDVLVADIMGRIEKGQFGGDNLIFGIFLATGRGFVVDGSFRDLDGVIEHGFPVYSRGQHPGVREDAMLVGVDVPTRIGPATVMPGDVVLGDRTGVVFIPPHLVEEIVRRAGGQVE
jgi:regulator of RNase E activity RraA